MMRVDPREGYLNAQDKYELCRNELIFRKDVLRPFYNMWPEYKRHDEFIKDFEFTVWVPLSHLNHFTGYMGSHPQEVGDINAMMLIETASHMKSQYLRQLYYNPQYEIMRKLISKAITVSRETIKDWSNQTDVEYVDECFKNLMSFQIPPCMNVQLAMELMIPVEEVDTLVLEYK